MDILSVADLSIISIDIDSYSLFGGYRLTDRDKVSIEFEAGVANNPFYVTYRYDYSVVRFEGVACF